MSAQKKEVVYIDVDDEITGIIGKVQESSGKIVALVLPKRAMVLQSIVNLKLLKRTADQSKKNLVLITSEAALLPLAGAVGVHVAKTLQSKPAVPPPPQPLDSAVLLDEAGQETDVRDEAAALDPSASVGQLAGLDTEDDTDTIEVDNEDAPVAPAMDGKKPAKQPFNKKLKVPDFNKFRLWLFVGIAAVVLLVAGWFVAFKVLPSAHIVIITDNQTVNTNVALTASPKAQQVDEATMTVPAVAKQLKKTESQKVAATGKKDVGTKASGTVTMSTQTNCATPVSSIMAGTTVSAAGFNFITQEEAKFAPSGFEAGKCVWTSNKVPVVAQSAGDQYNLSARNYTVAGFSNITAAGTAMSGGLSKVVTVVEQQDIDGAKQKILDANTASATEQLTQQLKDEACLPLAETFAASQPLVTGSPNVGDEAAEVTVTVVVTYDMTGAKQDAITQLLDNDIKKQIDTSKQTILDNGLDAAVVHLTENKQANGNVKFTVQTSAVAGVQQNADEIKQAVAGKKRGEVQELILSRPGVKDVTVTYKPLWVYGTTKNVHKITIVFQQANGNAE